MLRPEDRQMSENELRIQRSLERLNVPDWYKKYSSSTAGSSGAGGSGGDEASAAGKSPSASTKSREFGSGTGLAGGWSGLSSSKAASLTSLQSTGRTHFSRFRSSGAASSGGARSSRESLMSPSSTASASPSPYYERSSFTYGMPYALSRFASARMSCGASPASLSPSPSPVGGVGVGSPLSSAPLSRHRSYSKAPYLGWRSQERLNASKQGGGGPSDSSQRFKILTPAERLAADLLAQKSKASTAASSPSGSHAGGVTPSKASCTSISICGVDSSSDDIKDTLEITLTTSPKKETASSDLSLNNSEESNSHKLNRVRSSIKEVSNAIVDYVNENKEGSINGGASPRRGFVWLESSFVGTKVIDSPLTPDSPSVILTNNKQTGSNKHSSNTSGPRIFKFDEEASSSVATGGYSEHHRQRCPEESGDGGAAGKSRVGGGGSHDISSSPTASAVATSSNGAAATFTPYISRNDDKDSPTLEDILDSLLALRPPKHVRGHQREGRQSPNPHQPEDQGQGIPQPPSQLNPTPISDWQERMNAPVLDTAYFPINPNDDDNFFTATGVIRSANNNSESLSRTQNISGTTTTCESTTKYVKSSYGDDPFVQHESAHSVDESRISSNFYSGGGDSNQESNVEFTADFSRAFQSTATTNENIISAGLMHRRGSNNSNEDIMEHRRGIIIDDDDDIVDDLMSPRELKVSDSTSTAVELDENDLLQRQADELSLLDKEEDTFGNPTDMFTSNPSSNNNSNTNINIIASSNTITTNTAITTTITAAEQSNSPTPPGSGQRHRRVSFDLDISDKEEKSSSRSRRDESVGGTIHCRNSKCGKTATGLEARREFKTCHNCNAYYCSRECRRAHWEKHKKVCMQSRVGALCKQIINFTVSQQNIVTQLSAVARRGLLAKGRGCVKLFFSSSDRAERFLNGGLPELPEPWYIPINDILPEEMGAQTFTELNEQCKTYNGDSRFVLYVSVCVVNEVPTSAAVKWEREMISRSAKLRLLIPRNFEETQAVHHHAATAAHLFPATMPTVEPSADQPQVPPHRNVEPSTAQQENVPPLPPHHSQRSQQQSSDDDMLILRSVPGHTSHQLSGADHKRIREISFANIQKHLIERGVDLRASYPDIYQKLCNYVEYDEPFFPVTIYPKNVKTGTTFICVIMPQNSDTIIDEEHVSSFLASQRLPSSPSKVTTTTSTTTAGSTKLRRIETIDISQNAQ